MTTPTICLELTVTLETLFREFETVQQKLILESWINLDFHGQTMARDDLLTSVVDILTKDTLLHDLLMLDERPQHAFLCHVRKEIAVSLLERFRVQKS